MYSPWWVPFTGLLLLSLGVFQLLVGQRTIKFKGALHYAVHKWTAWVLLVGVIGHALFALHTFFAWPF